MPLPEPNNNETQSDFISRCLSNQNVQNDSSSHEQAVAICMSQWRNREPKSMSTNDTLLKAIKSRGQKKEPFEYGILTADRWVLNLQDQIGLDNCYKFASKSMNSFGDILNKAANTLVYSNSEMVVDETFKSTAEGRQELQDYEKSHFDEDLDLPKNTLMVFRHILTSSNKDRDGDILRSEGMSVDPKMLLLWQHVHTLPIGKSIRVVNQDTNNIEMISAIVDMNELSHDSAVMIDNGMGRFSHGFRALEFEEMKTKEGDFSGFDVKRAEIMEESLVSVPANVDAETQEVLLSLVEGGKLTSPIMKEYGKTIRDKRELVVPGISYNMKTDGSEVTVTCGTKNDLETVVNLGLIGEKKDECLTKGDGEERGEGNDSTSEKADDSGNEKDEETKNTEVSEVKRAGKLTGSWEMITKELETQTKRHMLGMGLDMGPDDWTYIIATFSDKVVVCVEKPQSGVPDEFRYFNVAWEMQEGKPKLIGSFEQVDIVTTAEIRERLASLSPKMGNDVDEASVIVLTETTEAQKRALISQLKSMLPSKLASDYAAITNV